MKKIIILTLAVAMIATCVAGCGAAGAANPDETTDQPDATNPSTTPDTPDTTDKPDATKPTEPSGPSGPSGANIEGDLRDLIAQIYANYNNREDVKAALAELEEINARLGELNEIIWDPDLNISEDELAKLQEEQETLNLRNRELSKFFIPFTNEIDLSKDGSENGPDASYYIGSNDIPFTEAVASEAMIMTNAYSLVLLRLEDGADVAAAMAKIREGADPQKWICVGVDPSDVVVDSIGNLVILIMANNSSELHESFLELAA